MTSPIDHNDPNNNDNHRRQIIYDLFEIIDKNQNHMPYQVLASLNMKLQDLYLANERFYKLCRNWMKRKHCRFGNRCRFQHRILVKLPKICYHHAMGQCYHGPNCYFTHNINESPLIQHPRNDVTGIPPIPTFKNYQMNDNCNTTT